MFVLSTLEIKNLYVSVEEKAILKGLSLTVKENEIHALMGPNGNGKSTLLSVIMGNPKFKIESGEILFNNQDVCSMTVDERSRAGIFLGMQYPSEISGVTNSDFLRSAVNARLEKPMPLFQFIKQMEQATQKVGLKSEMAHRFLNEGFSGGEKKRNEILQMQLLKPKIAMLDEIDSGLDVDALKIVADTIKEVQKTNQSGLLVVSHYERFYELLKPTHAHVLIDGRIVMSGDASLTKEIDEKGYDWIAHKLGLNLHKEEQKQKSLGTCGAKKSGEII